MKTITIDGVEYNLTPKKQNPIMEIKLEWGKTADKKMTWEEAKKWCEEQGEGWRMPTIEELEEASRQKSEGFGTGYYWSATENSTTIARIRYFADGNTNYDFKTYSYSVRCVRSVK